LNPNICYAPSVKFKPEWAYASPKGKRLESFVVPFSFSVTANGQVQENFPWKLDDDTDWYFRGVIFPQAGTAEAANAGTTPYVGNPALVRIRDPYGNPITNGDPIVGVAGSRDLVLAVGAIGQSAFYEASFNGPINASGFPFGWEIYCGRGGVILFDFLIPVLTGAPNPVQMQGTMLGAKAFDEC
jgi:hypothetical protein